MNLSWKPDSAPSGVLAPALLVEQSRKTQLLQRLCALAARNLNRLHEVEVR
jgi:hypothetical protein